MNDKKKKIRIPKNPKHPERICWGCDKYCRADKMLCGNGSDRSQHPCEVIGEDWTETLTPDDLEKIEIV